MRISGSGVVVALLLSANVARAQVETVTLDYDAPAEGCPARAELEAEIGARTSKVAFGATGRRFTVKIERGEAGFVGTLSIREGDSAPSERRIDGSDCVEVASALGLVAALAIDPEAKTAPREELPIAPLPVEPAPAPVPEPAPKPAARPELAPLRVPEPSPAPAARWTWSAGLSLAARTGPASEWLFAFGPESELVRHAGSNAQSIGFSLRAARTGALGPSDPRARFDFLAWRLALAPVGIETASWRARLAALLELGAVRAEGRDVAIPESQIRLWAATGLGARFGRRLGERFYLDLSAAVLANLTRDRFVFETPRSTVHEVPLASFEGGISAGYLFP